MIKSLHSPLPIILALVASSIAADPGYAQGEPVDCPRFAWTTLGTAGGPISTAERGQPSNLLSANNYLVVVDTGDGTVNKLAEIGVNLGAVDAVFLSHLHLDHTTGLSSVIGLRWINGVRDPLRIYGPPGTHELVTGILVSMMPAVRIGLGAGQSGELSSNFVDVVELDGDRQFDLLPGLSVTTARNSHFDIDELGVRASPISLSYRFQLDVRSITYTGDTGPSDAVTELAAGTNLLVSEIMDYEGLMRSLSGPGSPMPPEMLGQVSRHLRQHHLTGVQVGEMAASANVSQVLLTHFAMAPSEPRSTFEEMRSDIGRTFNGDVVFGEDLQTIEVTCD